MTTAKDSKPAAGAPLANVIKQAASAATAAVSLPSNGAANLLVVSAAFLVGVGVGASDAAPQKGAQVHLDLGDDEGKDRDDDCGL